uniref:Uncharacterized protein n=1 Tax=Anguilla anguilla TaxID=7936 RepID=A0A0E9QQF1_ANGAN
MLNDDQFKSRFVNLTGGTVYCDPTILCKHIQYCGTLRVLSPLLHFDNVHFVFSDTESER